MLAGFIVTLGCSTTAVKPRAGPTWQTHAYRVVRISAPSSWHVYRDAECIPNEHPGALALGAGNGSGNCMDQAGPPGTVVQLSDLSPGALLTLPPPVERTTLRIHGLTILSSTYSTGVTIWQVASAGVEVTGRGPSALTVMATLRPA